MNSFETDLKRAVCSVKFIVGLLLEFLILCRCGFDSELFRISVPVVVTFPYSTAWLGDYQSGFIKEYLPRCGKNAYICGKFLSCGISGGGLISTACFLYLHTKAGQDDSISLLLLFISGMLWAVVSATLAALSNSRYIAYGGSFVLFYAFVILYERYFKGLYCLYPVEWFAPAHTWVLADDGVILMCTGLIGILFFVYYEILGRCIEDV